ncbi:hypothetical protein J4443_03705 [Candidatus Woesearchaeota archaeon]|nr:hypothetical protein [Candidatus Woesearchaeota archaeon]
MKTEKSIKKVGSIWGLITLVLAKLVAPMPTTNRWLYKMGESTSNLRNYGFSNLDLNRLDRSLLYSLTSY